jgi:hypothetical protein
MARSLVIGAEMYAQESAAREIRPALRAFFAAPSLRQDEQH